jgi:predicted Zn-dependent peptidase
VRARLALVVVASLLPAPAAFAVDRSHPPQAGPPQAIRLPAVQKLNLSNGLPVFLAEMHDVPTVQVVLVLKSGASADPPAKPGLASLTADMLDEGAGGKDALALADAIDFLGADLSTGSSWDLSSVALHVPVARLEAALPLLADVALRPEFPEQELERIRRQRLTGLLQARDEPAAIAGLAVARALFGQKHRYGLPAGGNAASLATIKASDLRGFHAEHYRPSNAALIVVGDVKADVVLPLLENAFAGWPKAAAPRTTGVPEPPQLKERVFWLVDRPGAAQSAIRIGRVGPDRSTPDFPILQVMNTLLGGSFTSRLNRNLREQHGYTYGAGSRFDFRRVGGVFLAASDVQTPSTADALKEFLTELARIRTPATPEEVERARNYLALGYAGDFETSGQLAGKLAEQWLYALPDDVFTSFVPKALAAGVDQVRGAAAARIDPAGIAIVIVGDRAKVEAPLRALNVAPLRVLSIADVMGPAPKLD